MTRLHPDSLLAQSGWMPAFCRSLVRDPHLADDIAQETWLAALRRGPRRPGALPRWLRAVARNAARQTFRRQTIRDGEPRAEENAELAPSAEEALERAEFRRVLVEAALALDEPYRSTVVLHHFEEGIPEPIAPVAPLGTQAEIRGRFLLAGGAPAVGVPLTVHGWGANHERRLMYGVPEDWEDPTGETDDDGCFALRFDPPRAFQFTFDAKAMGFVAAGWRWSEILPGETKDLGEVTLWRGGAIEGRIVDPQGNPLPGDRWIIYAEGTRPDGSSGRQTVREHGFIDPSTGVFRIEDLPSGRVSLRGQASGSRLATGPTVIVEVGETVDADLVHDAPEASRRIAVITTCRKFHVMNRPDPAHIKLLGAGPEPRVPADLTPSQRHIFDDLEPGLYSVVIDDPRYLPWREDGVTPGTDVRALLEGNAAIVLRVVDEETGEPVLASSVRLKFRNVNFRPDEFEVHDGTEPLPGGLITGIFPGDYTLAVRVEGFGVRGVEIDALLPNETREVTVAMGEATVLEAMILHPDGTPAVGVDVMLVAPAAVEDSPTSPFMGRSTSSSNEERHRKEIDAGQTDADGCCVFELVRPGAYALHARRGLGIQLGSEVVQVGEGERRQVRLTLARGGTVTGTVTVPAGSTPVGLRISAHPEIELEGYQRHLFMQRATAELANDGRYELGPLPPGEVEFLLLMPSKQQRSVQYDGEGRARGSVSLGMVDVREGETVRRDFTVGEAMPVPVTLRLRTQDVPVAGAHLTVIGVSESIREVRLEGRLDGDGSFGPELLFPGEWSVFLHGPDSDWDYQHPQPILIDGGNPQDFELSVELARGEVKLRDASTGEPLANRRVVLVRPEEQRLSSRILRTNAAGEIEVVLQSGAYLLGLVTAPEDAENDRFISRPEFDESRTVQLVWTSLGPAVAELRL